METDRNDLGDGEYGLINFRLILNRNYIFLILIHLYLFWNMAEPFSLIKKEQWVGSTAIFTYSKTTW